MKNKIAAVVLTLALLAPLTGNAASTYRSNNTTSAIGATKVYLGVKYGLLTLEFDDADSDGTDLDNLGIVFGGHINDYLAIEFEYTQTVSSEEDDNGEALRADTTGIFLMARTMGALYAKARLGYTWIDQDFDSLGTDTVYGLAYGLGGGFEITDTFSLEAEYTVYPEADETDRFGDPDTFGGIDLGDLNSEMISITAVWSYN